MGRRAGQSASPLGRSPSAWSKPKAPSSPRSWLIPSSCFTRSTRPPPHATARLLKPAGPRAILPMRRSASSCSASTATNSRPGGQKILRHAPSPASWNSAAPRSTLRTLLSNMLRDALKSYYPQALALAGQDLFAPLACQFLLRWPSLQELQKARKETIRKFYYAHNCRRLDLINQRLEAIAAMIPLTCDQAVIEPAKVQVRMLARQLLQLAAALKEYDARIAQLFLSHADAAIWQSFPGAGPTLAPGSAAPLAANAPATRAPPPSSNTAALPRSPSAAARTSTGSIAAGAGPTSSIRASSNTPTSPSSIAPGPNSSCRSRSPKAKNIPPPCAPGLQMAAHHVRLLA